MSSGFLRKLVSPFLHPDSSPSPDIETDNEHDIIDSPSPIIDDSSISSPVLVEPSRDQYVQRSSDRPINPRKLPDEFIEIFSDILLEEEDIYTKLILYSHIVCGTKIDVLRDRFVVNTTRGKSYIASREFVRHRLNKSLDKIRLRYQEEYGTSSFVGTIDDSEDPYRAEFAARHTNFSPADYSPEFSNQTSSLKGAVNEVEEESGHQKEEFQAGSNHQEKRTKFPRKKLLFIVDEEDIEETDFDGLSFSKNKEPSL